MANVPTEIVRAAKASQASSGIPASVAIAQWALESGWGKHMPPGSNNPFGMKARKGDPSVTVLTKEYSRLRGWYVLPQAFRKFASIEEAFQAHASLLQQPVYAKARRSLPQGSDAFAQALTGVYATDPKYGSLLISIMKGSNLYQYDK